jgi:SnoaL-like domain
MPDDDLRAWMAALEGRIRELEDDRAIRQLLARYGFSADMEWDEVYVDLFTDDGAIDGAIVGTAGRLEGRADIEETINKSRDHGWIEGRSMHVQGNNLTTHIEGENAVAESYSFAFVREEGGMQLFTCNANRWTLKKIDGAWRIRERLIRSPGTDEYLNVLSAGGYSALLTAD